MFLFVVMIGFVCMVIVICVGVVFKLVVFLVFNVIV